MMIQVVHNHLNVHTELNFYFHDFDVFTDCCDFTKEVLMIVWVVITDDYKIENYDYNKDNQF